MTRFLRFCAAGTLGYAVDAGLLQALAGLAGANPYAARALSFLAAASVTWRVNRRYTFRVEQPPSRDEWGRYVALMGLGALVNYGVFALGIHASEFLRARLWLAVALGSVAGLGVNYLSSRRLLADA
ncbi:MAG: GtrA family protein [Betaproteobacteria bacterium]|nr:GtrA family protein [Betaproteobacteria bacterium]